MGFTNVFDYAAGKQDWFANGLPSEGKRAEAARLGDLVLKDIPTCFLSESVGRVKERVERAGWDMAVVVGEGRVILGLLRNEQLAGSPEQTVEQVMRPGPSTWRPNLELGRMIGHAQRYQLHHLMVSTSDGVLVGVLRRADIERLAESIKVNNEHEPAEE